jgi:hypothetical protein
LTRCFSFNYITVIVICDTFLQGERSVRVVMYSGSNLLRHFDCSPFRSTYDFKRISLTTFYIVVVAWKCRMYLYKPYVVAAFSRHHDDIKNIYEYNDIQIRNACRVIYIFTFNYSLDWITFLKDISKQTHHVHRHRLVSSRVKPQPLLPARQGPQGSWYARCDDHELPQMLFNKIMSLLSQVTTAICFVISNYNYNNK